MKECLLQVLDDLNRVHYILYGDGTTMIVAKQFSYRLFYFRSISTTRDYVETTVTGRITKLTCNNYTISVGSTFRAEKINLKTGKANGTYTFHCNTISKKDKEFIINISKKK